MAGLFGGKKIIRQYLGTTLLWEAPDTTAPLQAASLSPVSEMQQDGGEMYVSLSASGGVAPYTYSNPSFGTISGSTLTLPLDSTFSGPVTFTVTDSLGATASGSLSVNITEYVEPSTDDVIIAYWGQSELMNATTPFYDGAAGTATDPIHQPLLEEGRVRIWWHDRNPEGNGATGVRSELVTNATTNTRFVAMANAMIPNLPAGRNGAIIFQTRSGTGFQALVDDVLPRSWDDEVALHNAATDNGAKMVSAIHFSWNGSPRGFRSLYGEAIHAVIFGKKIDGTDYGPRPFTALPGKGDNEFPVHHILADLYDFSEGKTRVIVGEPHRYEAPGGDYEADCRDATRAMYAQSSEPSLVYGHPSLIYRNGKRDSTTGDWADYAHPSAGEGSRRIMAGLVASSMQALGYADWQPPSITHSYFAPDGSYMEFWSAAGPIQTIHGTLACGLKVDGSFVDGTIVNVSDGAQVDGAVRVTAAQAGIPKFTGTTNISFIKDNITGLSTIEEAEFGWMKYPAVDLGAAGFPSGVPVINNPEPAVFENSLAAEAASYAMDGSFMLMENTNHPSTTQKYTFKATVILSSSITSFKPLFKDQNLALSLLVGSGDIRTASAGVPLEDSPVNYNPGSRHTFVLTADPAAGQLQAYLDGTEVIRDFSGSPFALETNRYLRFFEGIVGDLEQLTVWREYTPDGSDPAVAPHKIIRGATLEADATADPYWKVIQDGTVINPIT